MKYFYLLKKCIFKKCNKNEYILKTKLSLHNFYIIKDLFLKLTKTRDLCRNEYCDETSLLSSFYIGYNREPIVHNYNMSFSTNSYSQCNKICLILGEIE